MAIAKITSDFHMQLGYPSVHTMLANSFTILVYMLAFLVFAQFAQSCSSFAFYLEDINSSIYVETMDNRGLE